MADSTSLLEIETERKAPERVFPPDMYDFLSETSAHGLSHIRKDKPLVWKFIWVLIFAAALVVTIHGLANIIIDYRSKPMATEYRMVTDHNLTIPDLIFCTGNRFNATKLRWWNVSRNLERVLHLTAAGIHPFMEIYAHKIKEEYDSLKSRAGFVNFEELLLRLTSNCEDLIHSCGGMRSSACCKIAQDYLSPFGRCVKVQGASVQLPIILKFPKTEEKSSYINQGTGMSTAIMLWVLENFRSTEQFVGFISPGKYHSIFLYRKQVEAVNNPPKFACNEDENYSVRDCFDNCGKSQNQLLSCGCADSAGFLRKVDLSETASLGPLCDPWQLACRLASKSRAEEIQTRKRIAQCIQECPEPCLRRLFDHKIATVDFDLDIVAELFSGNRSRAEGFAKHRAEISLAFESLDYVHIRQYISVTFGTVLSYLGGQLGLFLGCSILTIVHIFMFSCYALFKRMYR